jgi:hypothetical protein
MIKTLFFSIWLITHPVHVSMLSLDYSAEKESFNAFLKVYFDDFLRDSGLSGDSQKTLMFSVNDPRVKDMIAKYVNDKVRISVNDKQLSGTVNDFNLADNELKMNLSFGSARKIKTVTVRNMILTTLYNDQANMIIIKVNDFEEGIKLTTDEPEQTFRIK